MLSRPDHLKKLHTLLAREEERNGFVNCKQKLHNRHPTQHISRPARTGAFTSRGVEIQQSQYQLSLLHEAKPAKNTVVAASLAVFVHSQVFFQCARQKVRRKKALPETAEATVPPSLLRQLPQLSNVMTCISSTLDHAVAGLSNARARARVVGSPERRGRSPGPRAEQFTRLPGALW